MHDREQEVWIADSAASCHMTPSNDLMYECEACEDSTVTVANSHDIPIIGYGKLLVPTRGHDGQQTFTVSRVAHVNDLDVNSFFLQ